MRRPNSTMNPYGSHSGRRGSLVDSLLLIALVCLSGCGDKNRGTVTGQVTLDGAPLSVGAIRFIPLQEDQGRATGGTIQDGVYSLKGDAAPVLGTYRVEIRANRKTGRLVQKPMAPEGDLGEELVQAIAAEYNDNSTLTLEVQAGNNEANWDVKSREVAEG